MEELLKRMATWLAEQPEVDHADKINDEDTIGIALTSGEAYLLVAEVV